MRRVSTLLKGQAKSLHKTTCDNTKIPLRDVSFQKVTYRNRKAQEPPKRAGSANHLYLKYRVRFLTSVEGVYRFSTVIEVKSGVLKKTFSNM